MNARSDRFIPALFSLALALGSSSALADEPTAPPVAPAVSRAEALFQEGKALLEQGRFAEACDRLAKSDGIDPNISTLGLLAGCHEQQGRTASALREYRETVKRAEAVGDSRADFARERAAALEPKAPKISVRVPRPSASMEVSIGFDRVAPEQFGSDILVDPGAYEVVARAPGKREFRVTVTVKEGAREVVDVPDLVPPDGPAYALRSGPVSAAAPPIAPSSKPVAPPPPASGISARNAAALVAGGVALVGVGVGAVFTARASSKNAESVAIANTCSVAAECDRGHVLRDEAFQAGTISTVSFSASAVGAAMAFILLIVPSGSAEGATKSASARNVWLAPRIGVGEGGASIIGRF